MLKLNLYNPAIQQIIKFNKVIYLFTYRLITILYIIICCRLVKSSLISNYSYIRLIAYLTKNK